MERAQKEKKVALLHEAFEANNLAVVIHQSGMSVGEVTALRAKMREAGATFRVTKNRLARIALQGTKFEHLADLFTGPTAVALSQDPVAAARVAAAAAKGTDKFNIIGGGLGDKSLALAEVDALAKLPSLDELRARLVGMIQTPATRIAGVLQAPGGQLARVLNGYATKDDAA